MFGLVVKSAIRIPRGMILGSSDKSSGKQKSLTEETHEIEQSHVIGDVGSSVESKGN